MFFYALSPILWLIISLSVFKMPAWKACPIALIISFFSAMQAFEMSFGDTLTAALEGSALALWPILSVIVAAIFTYNLSVSTKGIDKIKQMLSSVSTDQRMLVLIIAWGFGGFLECMSGFGTAVAIGASMLASVGINPVSAVAVCLLANSVPTAYGSIGLPLTTLSRLTEFDPSLIATYATLQLGFVMIIMPFLMIAAFGKSFKALRGMIPVCLIAGVMYFIPSLAAAYFTGAGLAGVAGAIFAMGSIVLYAKKFPVKDPEYEIDEIETDGEISFSEGVRAWLPFILIFVFLMLTSKLVPPVHNALNQISTSLMIYTGEDASLFTINWITAPGTLIFVAAVISGFINNASVSDMVGVFSRTLKTLVPTFITIITIIGTARIMGYSGMTTSIATTTVAATGMMYPAISAFIGSVGSFITGSATSSCVLLGKLQADSALVIGASPNVQAWIAASNATGSCLGKIMSPQSIAIGVAAVGVRGVESQLMAFGVKVYIPFIIVMGAVIYFGQMLL